MERKRSKQASIVLWSVVTALISQNLVICVMSAANFGEQKTYYPPSDPHAGTPPVSSTPPSGGHATPTPSHHPPSHHHGGSPPANCGNPPSGGHHPTTPSPPRGHYDPPSTPTPTTPYTPTPTTPTTPSPPSGGGGGYYNPPPTTTPSTPTTPTIGTPPVVVTPPTIDTPPTYTTPPTTPIIDPGTPASPGIAFPSPPFPFDPNSPPFPCTYWRNHPTLIWGLFGFWGTTVGTAFGMPGGTTGLPGIGANADLLQALSNTRTDGFGDLYREGTAALLNSMVHSRFPYSTSQVRDSFATALGSNKAAAHQARLFKLANEGRT